MAGGDESDEEECPDDEDENSSCVGIGIQGKNSAFIYMWFVF